MPHDPHPLQNRLLAALPPDDAERLFPHLERVELELGQVLAEVGDPMRHAYFPVAAIVSLLNVMANGDSAEIAVVGNEGMVGVTMLLGGGCGPSRAVVQNAGPCYRVPGKPLRDEFARGGALQRLLLLYVQAHLTQIAQTAVCNRHHSLGQQLCRWLLLSLDRLPSQQVSMTQQLIANMLGVRREGVTEAAGKLQKQGLIAYRRGEITILDRPGLEAASCECYAVVRDEFERLMPAPAHFMGNSR